MWKYKKKGRWVYAMYKGDECLAIGTSDEICEQMGIKKNTFGFYRTKTRLKRRENSKRPYRVIVRIDNQEEQ